MPTVEDHFRELIEEGQFDNLSAPAKLIHWDENPFMKPNWPSNREV
jgi:hypothetical protein